MSESHPAFQKHYRVKDLAELWGFCDNTIIRLFSGEPDVVRLESVTAKRSYVSLSIPESAAVRVYDVSARSRSSRTFRLGTQRA